MQRRTAIPAATPLDALQSGVRQRWLSEEGRRVWSILRTLGLSVLLMAGAAWVPGITAYVLGALFGGLACWRIFGLLAAHDGAARRIWTWVFGVCVLLLVIPFTSMAGRVLFSIGATGFLVFRSYGCLRELGSRRRAAVFAGASLALLALGLAPEGVDVAGGFGRVVHHASGAARFAVVLFCVMSSLRIFLAIRLHFLRLRSKLAVAGLFVAAVPILLLLTLSVAAIYGLLGGNRATRGAEVMADWLALLQADALVGPGPFGEGFGAKLMAAGESEYFPPFHERLTDAVAHAPFDPMPEALWLRTEGQLWALRVVPAEQGWELVGGRRVGGATVQRLADLLDAEVQFRGGEDGDVRVDATGVQVDDAHPVEGLRARPTGISMEDPENASFLETWTAFGAASMEVYDLGGGGLAKGDMLLTLKIRPGDVFARFVAEDNQINRFVALGFAFIVGFFFVFEVIALYFGLRIIGGITGAVGALHRATQRLARGDLDSWIELPNEDEFGDLADSFNEMTTAIRLAQDQIVQKELLEQQLAMARNIQERLLPTGMPRIPGYEIAGSSTPSLQVGGDYFDFVHLSEGRLGIAVADVTGKGVPASLLMANVQAGLHGQVIHPGTAAEIVGRMNELLYASTDSHMFVTFAYVVLDAASGVVESVSAGHEPTLLVRANGTVEKLGAGGLMLGMMEGQNYAEVTSRLNPGDVLVLYTDGVTEAMGPAPRSLPAPGASGAGASPADGSEDDDEPMLPFFEEERLVEICVARRHQSAEEIRGAILASVREFAGPVPQSDDITIVVVKREAGAKSDQSTR